MARLLFATLGVRLATLLWGAYTLLAPLPPAPNAATPQQTQQPRHLAALRLAKRVEGELAPSDVLWGCETREVTLRRRKPSSSSSSAASVASALRAPRAGTLSGVVRPSREPRRVAALARSWGCAWDGAHFMFRATHGLAYGNAVRATYTVRFAAPPPLDLAQSSEEEEGQQRWTVKATPIPPTPIAAGDELLRMNGAPLPTPLSVPAPPFNLTFAVARSLPREAAFAPLWPWLLWVARCGGSPAAAIALATACSTLGVLLAAAARRAVLNGGGGNSSGGGDNDDGGKRRRAAATRPPLIPLHRLPMERDDLWLLVSPGALFLCAPYSECLFLPLAAGWLLALAHGRHGTACALGVALPLARGLGAFFALPAAMYALRDTKGRRAPWALRAALPLAPALGYALHLAHLHWAMGGSGWGASGAAQRGFVAQFSAANLLKPWRVVRTVLGEGLELGPGVAAIPAWTLPGVGEVGGLSWHSLPAWSLLDRLALGAVAVAACAAAKAQRLPAHVWCVAAVLALVPPLSGSMMSYVRFAVVAGFPLLWGVGKGVPRWAIGAVAAAALALQADLAARFAVGGWAG